MNKPYSHLNCLSAHWTLFHMGSLCDRLRSRIVEASARSGCSLIVHSVCIDFSYRWLACVPLYISRHLITCTAHLSIELWKMRYINDSK